MSVKDEIIGNTEVPEAVNLVRAFYQFQRHVQQGGVFAQGQMGVICDGGGSLLRWDVEANTVVVHGLPIVAEGTAMPKD